MNAMERLFRPESDVARLVKDDDGADWVASSCFVFVRDQRSAAGTLTLKSPGGNAFSLDWTWTPDIVYLPGYEVPLTLVYSSRGFKVEIIGTKLDVLATRLQQRRVVLIEANDRLQHLARGDDAADQPHVEEFRIVPLEDGEDLTLLKRVLEVRGAPQLAGRERLERVE